MKYFQKEFTQNKGSALLSCIFTIFTIMLIVGIMIYNNLVNNRRDDSSKILAYIYTENRLSEIFYQEGYVLEGQRVEACGDIFGFYVTTGKYIEFLNGKPTFRQIYYYSLNEEGRVQINKVEVYGE